MLRIFVPILFVMLSACGSGPGTEVAERRAQAPSLDLPPMKTFAGRSGSGTNRPNSQIAQDFLDLSFQMESGRELPRFTRFTGPIKVSLSPNPPAYLQRDLNRLLARLRSEAGIPISRAKPGEQAQIFIEAVPMETLRKDKPNVACFVTPNVAGWKDYKRNRRSAATNWTKLKSRDRATIIIPSNDSPQEIRDCLHEEIAQALGPLNDLYRLPDSIFNDDNFHSVLTGFDMLILRAYYAPELRNGMSRKQVASLIPGILARLNPKGNFPDTNVPASIHSSWNSEITNALSLRTSGPRRINAANRAVKIARSQGWRDNRMAFSLFVQGRAILFSDPETAIKAFREADKLYRALYGNSVQTARISTQMAAFALSSGRYDAALTFVDDAIPVARASENAGLLSTLLMIKAEAFEQMNRPGEARSVRLDALAWGRYGFGAERNVRARLSEVKALVPPTR